MPKYQYAFNKLAIKLPEIKTMAAKYKQRNIFFYVYHPFILYAEQYGALTSRITTHNSHTYPKAVDFLWSHTFRRSSICVYASTYTLHMDLYGLMEYFLYGSWLVCLHFVVLNPLFSILYNFLRFLFHCFEVGANYSLCLSTKSI